MYDEILQAIIAMASEAAGVKVLTGSMPPDNGVAMIGNAAPTEQFKDVGSVQRFSIVCNGKHTEQQTVINRLEAIHAALTRRRDYPGGSLWQILSIESVASPRLLGREQNSMWLYASSMLVKFFVKGI